MTYYISGPMTGYEDFNFPAFKACADAMRAQGHDVLSAHEVEQEEATDWQDYLRADLIAMLQKCDAIVMLKGWEKSKGALLELHVAQTLEFPVFFWDAEKQEAQATVYDDVVKVIFENRYAKSLP